MRKTLRVPIIMWLALVVCLAIMVTLFMAQTPAKAESPGLYDATAQAPTDFFGWGALATVAGATTGTMLVVQLIKPPLDSWRHIPTRYVVYVIALIILTGAQLATKGLNWPDMALTALNAIIVTLAAMKTYELTIGKTSAKA